MTHTAGDVAGLPSQRVQVYLCLDLAAGSQRVIDAGRAFFRLGFEKLGHTLYDQVVQAVERRAYLGIDPGRAIAGGVSAICGGELVDESGRVRKRNFVYSPRRFDDLLKGFDMCPTLVGLDVETWGYRQGSLDLAEPSLHISWCRNTTEWADPLPGWVLLYADSTYEQMLGSQERQNAVLTFLREVASPADPACGEVSYQVPGQTYTAPLEYLLRRQRKERDSISESRYTIRSYSWVTIISEEIGQRLGGQLALSASGAFQRVEHLAAGGYLLQATEQFEQYQYEQARRVFQVLAPALPAGTPLAPKIYPSSLIERGMEDDPNFLIVQEDPRSVLD